MMGRSKQHRKSISGSTSGESPDGEKELGLRSSSHGNLSSPNVFNGYNDSETGFYTVYRNLFEEVSRVCLTAQASRQRPGFQD